MVMIIVHHFIIITTIMSSILAHIKTMPISDRSREMVNFNGSNLKLARTLGQINFLCDCRSLKIIPTFILNKTAQVSVTHSNQRVTTQVKKLQKTILNEEIRDAFRRKAFLQRSMTRSAHVVGERTNEWIWLHNEGRKIFIKELITVKHRLLKKLKELCEKVGYRSLDLTRTRVHKLIHTSEGEERSESRARESARTEGDHQKNLPNSSPVEPTRPHATREEQNSGNEETRLINLSKQPISDQTLSLLGKGPKFALSNRVTPSLLQSVEVGIERAFYGLKWKTTIEARKAATTHDPNALQSQVQEEAEDESVPALAAMPRPYFSDSSSCQPPVVTEELERNLEKVKSKIMGLYRGAKKAEPLNTTSTQREQLETLKKDENIIIKRSDKCKSLVVMDTTDYIAKAENITNTYENISTNPTTKLEDETKKLMKATLKDKIPVDYIQRLLPQHTRTAEFYGLPKTHKTGNPLRPIVSACGDPLDKLSWFIQIILTQLLSFIPAHLSNTDSYLTKMKNVFPGSLPPGSIIFTLDVCNLYGSIPIQEGIDAVMHLVQVNLTKLNLFGITPTDLRTLLSHVLTNNFLRFGSKTYKQTSGIAMGNRVAPPVAITFMHILETGFMTTVEFVPMLYVRYIDDILGVWTHGIDRLNHFYNCLNAYNRSIKFTMQSTFDTGQLPFLDTLITLDPSGAYSTEIYFKPMTAPIILHYTSAHPMSTKRNILNAEVKRAIRVSSDKQTRARSVNRIKLLFQQNGYPDNLINKTVKNNMHNISRKTSSHTNKTTNLTETFLRLPYIDETTVRRVNGILRSSGTPLKVAWTSGPTLGQKLITSAFSNPPCPAGQRLCHTCECGLKGKCATKNVVYKITCKMCEVKRRDESYIGECTRPVRYRFNEHLSDARLRKPDTPLGEHIADVHTNVSHTDINSGFKIEIINLGRDSAEIKIAESIQIRNRKPSLNVMRSSWPLVH